MEDGPPFHDSEPPERPVEMKPWSRGSGRARRGRLHAARLARVVAVAGWAALVPGACSTGAPPASSAHPGGAGSGGVNSPLHRDAPYLVLISLDGFRHDYRELYDTPNLDRIAGSGVTAEGLVPPFPSTTFPSHYSIVTGLYPGHHGLVGNRFLDPVRGAEFDYRNRVTVEDGTWYGGEPIWVTAEKQGMVAASYFWVGSEAAVQGLRPTVWKAYDGSVPNEARVDSVLAWLSLPAERRPHLFTLYMSDVDGAGHDFGPQSREVARAVEEVDAAVGRLLDGLEAIPHGDRVHVVVVSDHGMARWEPDDVVRVDTERWEGILFETLGAYGRLFVDGDAARAARVADSLEAVLPGVEVYLVAGAPERLHLGRSPRVGDILLLPEVGVLLRPEGVDAGAGGGSHGWDPRHPEMHGIFLATGPLIRPGLRLRAFEAVHLYPFMTAILGLDPARVDGRPEVLRDVLRGDAGGPG